MHPDGLHSGPQIDLSKFKKIKTLQSMFSDHEGINFKEVGRILQDQAAGKWWS